MSKFAWVTLATNDTYSLGALVLANSLKRVETAHQLAVLVTPGVSESMRSKLKDVYNVVQEVDLLNSEDAANLALLSRPELGITFTKIHCWRLVQFEKCVFIDADAIVLQNCDELFDREELSAAPDVSWPDCFNSGVFVYRPSLDTFAKIIEFALKHGSFDGGDQGLLNLYFPEWSHKDISKHLPFTFNTTAFASYCYLPAFKQFRDKIKILHFAGKLKPWLVTFNSQNKKAQTPTEYQHAADLIQLWWNIFCEDVHSKLTEDMAGLAGALSTLKLGESATPDQLAYELSMRRQCWEAGNIDYAGVDSFDNIWKRITQTLESAIEGPDSTSTPAVQTTTEEAKQEEDNVDKLLTSADIEDGKIEYDSETNSKIQYKLIKGGYEVKTTTPQPNGTLKTQVRTFYDPTPVTAEEIAQKAKNRKPNGTIERIDRRTTVEYRDIEGGYEMITTVTNDDGTRSVKTQTIYDAVPQNYNDNQVSQKKDAKKLEKKKSVDKSLVLADQKKRTIRKADSQEETSQHYKVSEEQTVEEHRRVTQTTEISGKTVTSRKNSLQEQSIKSVTEKSSSDKKDTKKKKPKGAPAPPPDFIENDSTTVDARNVVGGTEYVYTTTLEDGRTVTTTKIVYEEEEVELTEDEIKQYKKQLREAEKHKNVTKATKLKSESGTKKVVPSDNPGEVTTVETIKIEGGVEYHYTTVTADGIVKKSTKTLYDAVPVEGDGSEDEQEIVEEYEEEIIEPGETTVKTIQSTRTVEQSYQAETITTKKEKKSKKSAQ